MLGVLVRLRYKLLWAQARTSTGRVAVFFALYALGVLAFAFLTFGGVAAGMAAVQTGERTDLVSAVLGSVLIAAVPTTLFLSVGPSAAFSDRVLRRFPLTPRARFLTRHFIGLLDPLWILYTGLTLGVAVGLHIVGACPLLVGVPVALAFIFVVYLTVAVFVVLVGKLVETRTGPLIMMALGMLIYVASVWLVPAAVHRGYPVRQTAVAVLRFTPAAAAALALVGKSGIARMAGVLMLAGWMVGMAWLLRLAERVRFARLGGAAQIPAPGESWYDRVGDLFGSETGPLIAKALRYYLRCNRIRYSLFTSPIAFFVMVAVQPAGAAGKMAGLLATLSMAGFAATFAMSVNYFGWDDTGVRRYPLLPMPMAAAIRAYSFVGVMLGALAALPLALATLLVAPFPVTWQLVLFIAFDVAAGLLLYHAAGMWLSVVAPRRCDFNAMMTGNVSKAATILLVAAIVPVVVLVQRWHAAPQRLVQYWWVVALLAGAGLMAYAMSLRATGRLLARRREWLTSEIAAKSTTFGTVS